MITLSSHVLDTTIGKPAANLNLTLTLPDGETIEATTDSDGRCNQWRNNHFNQGQYVLRFHVEPYLLNTHGNAFYPYIDIPFYVNEDGHYHIPLLVSPYGFSSYRGS